MNHHELLFANIERYRKDQKFCDITFDVMGTKFPLHRLVISSASNYFEAMFTKGLVKPDQKEVVMKGVTPSAFKSCIDYIYTSVININVNGVCQLFHASLLFQLEKLMSRCVDQIRAIIDFDNCIEFYQFSVKEECQEIEKESKNVMLKNAEKILTDDSIISTMDEESLSMMLKSDELNISDESVAFQALAKWTDIDKDRVDNFCDLLQYVRLPVIDRKFFTSVVYENKHMLKCGECRSYSQQTLLYIADGETRGLKKYQLIVRDRMKDNAPEGSNGLGDDKAVDGSDIENVSTTRDAGSNINDVTIDNDKEILVVNSDCKSFKLFDVENGTLTDDVKLDPIPVDTTCRALIHHNGKIDVDTTCRALIHHNGKIYVMGESNGSRSFYCDYRRNKKWHELPPMPNDHNKGDCYESSVVCYNNKILIVGGYIHDSINLVSCFCTQTNTWSKFPSLNEGRWDAATVMTDEHVYVIGGCCSGECLSSVEMFDSNKWNRLPSLNTARCYHAAVYHNQKIFVAGGWINSNHDPSVETFVEGDSCWTNIASLNIDRCVASMFTHYGKLYVFGGNRNKSNLYEVWCETFDTWILSEVEDDSIKSCKVLLCNKAIKSK